MNIELDLNHECYFSILQEKEINVRKSKGFLTDCLEKKEMIREIDEVTTRTQEENLI